MKTIAIMGVVMMGSLAVAQTVVPVEQEPQHHTALENAYIKVLDVVLQPAYVTLWHLHSHDNVSVRIATGMTRTDLIGAESTTQVAPVGRVSFNSASPPYTHRVANMGATPIHIIDIELGANTAPTVRAPDELAGHTTVLDNVHVRGTRIQLAAGESLPAHAHSRGWLEVVVVGRNPGHFTWHAAGSTAPVMTRSATPIEIVEIEPK